jgi:D-alanine-D-alanine ligase
MSNVIILFGGTSSERLVSVASGQNVSRFLPGAKLWFWSPNEKVYEVSASELAAHENAFVRPFEPVDKIHTFDSFEKSVESMKGHTVFLALHGGRGENGEVQAVLEKAGIAFTASSSAASALAFNKDVTKKIASKNGAKIAEAAIIHPTDLKTLRATLEQLMKTNGRWVLKPLADGSSSGLIHLISKEQIPSAAKKMTELSVDYLAEVFIEGRELTVGVVDFKEATRALPVSEVKLVPGGTFDYEGKYLGKGTEEITPAVLTQNETSAAQELALLTHKALGCGGYTRTDMILTDNGPVLLEINTLPGLTRASFIPQQLAAENSDFRAFLEWQIELARRKI